MNLEEYTRMDATAPAACVRIGDATPTELAALAHQAHDRVNPIANAMPELYEDAETVIGADDGPFFRGPVPAQGYRLNRSRRASRKRLAPVRKFRGGCRRYIL